MQTYRPALCCPLLSLVITTATVLVSAFPEGAPLTACTNGMFPEGHGVPSEQSSSPFQIEMNTTTYTEGTPIECEYDLTYSL